jgi:ribosome maturation factor RimP
MGLEERLRQVLEGVIEDEACEMVHLEFMAAGSNSALRIFIDKPAGITVEDCQQVSERVSAVLDVEDLIPTRYTLEVSSPGLERPLFREKDYIRFQGRRARLRTKLPISGQKNFKGILERCDAGILYLKADDRVETVAISLDNIQKANLVFEFKD